MSTFRNRSRLTIFADILKTTKESREGKNKTDIMLSANLKYPQANKYLDLLLINGFLRLDTRDRYKITKKGLEFIRTLESLNLRLR